jgi:hypothetical protein
MTHTISQLAQEAYATFERDNSDTTLWKTRDDAPEWVSELVHEAHGSFLPDDWRYDCIHSALSHIADSGADDEADLADEDHAFSDGHVDVYNARRAAWLASNLERGGYCDEAVEEGLVSAEAGIYALIGAGQYMECQEVWGSVVRSLADHLETVRDMAGEMNE